MLPTEITNKENIRVIIRIRPTIAREENDQCTLLHTDGNSVYINTQKNSKKDIKQFIYDYVASQNSSQEELFINCAQPICDSVLEGYNGTIFAYGQTGSGKTYTLLGPFYSLQNEHKNLNGTIDDENKKDTQIEDIPVVQDESFGILPRILYYLFDKCKQNENTTYKFSCSFLEIYQEQLSDLLGVTNNINLIIRDNANGVFIEGLNKLKISSTEEALSLVLKGTKLRHIASTGMNKESSRSHAVFSIYIEAASKMEAGGKNVKMKKSVFHIIDLAGSERQRTTHATGKRIKEAANINKSLMQLGLVIKNLTEGEQKHIPYRDSKLTHLLKDSLGGNARTSIIANISPANSNADETLSTLRFAQRAKLIQNKAIINEELTADEARSFKEEINKLKEKYDSIKQENFKLRSIIIENNQNKRSKSSKFSEIGDDELDQMVKDINLKDDELQALRKENEFLKDAFQKDELDIKVKEKEIDEYKSNLIEMENQITKYKAEIRTYVMENASLSNQLQKGEGIFSHKEQMFNSQINSLNQNLNEMKEMMQYKEQVIEELSAEINSCLHKLNDKDKTISEQSNTIEQKENEVSSLKKDIQEKETQIEELNSNISKMKYLIQKGEAEIKSKEEKIEGFKQKGNNLIDKYDEKINTLHESLESKNKEIDSLNKKLISVSSLLEQRKRANNLLEDTIKNYHQQTKTFLSAMTSYSSEIIDKTSEIQKLKKEKNDLLNQFNCTTLSETNIPQNKSLLISTLKKDLIKTKNELTQTKKQLDNVQKIITAYPKNTLLSMSNTLTETQTDLNTSKQLLDSSIDKIKRIFSGCDHAVFKLSDNVLMVNIEHKSLFEQYEILFSKIVDYVETLERMEKMLKEENRIKEDKIMMLNKEINLRLPNESDAKTNSNNVNYTNYKKKYNCSVVQALLARSDLAKSTFKTKRNFNDYQSSQKEEELKTSNVNSSFNFGDILNNNNIETKKQLFEGIKIDDNKTK